MASVLAAGLGHYEENDRAFLTLYSLSITFFHILIPPLGSYFIMQKNLIHWCWVYLTLALMRPPPSALTLLLEALCKTKHPWQRQSEAAQAQKMGFSLWRAEKSHRWNNIKPKRKHQKSRSRRYGLLKKNLQSSHCAREMYHFQSFLKVLISVRGLGPSDRLVCSFIWGAPLTSGWKTLDTVMGVSWGVSVWCGIAAVAGI